jgi:WD40 repeat protein
MSDKCESLATVGLSYIPCSVKFLSSAVLATGAAYGHIRLANLSNNLATIQPSMYGHSGQQVNALAFDGTQLISGGSDGSVYFWDYLTSQQLGSISSLPGSIISMAIFMSTKLVVGSGQNIYIVDLMSRKVMFTLKGHSQQVNFIDCSVDMLFSASSDYTVRLWNLTSLSNELQSDGKKYFETGVYSVLGFINGL